MDRIFELFHVNVRSKSEVNRLFVQKTLETTLAPPKVAEVGSYFGRTKVYLWIAQSLLFPASPPLPLSHSPTNAASPAMHILPSAASSLLTDALNRGGLQGVLSAVYSHQNAPQSDRSVGSSIPYPAHRQGDDYDDDSSLSSASSMSSIGSIPSLAHRDDCSASDDDDFSIASSIGTDDDDDTADRYLASFFDGTRDQDAHEYEGNSDYDERDALFDYLLEEGEDMDGYSGVPLTSTAGSV